MNIHETGAASAFEPPEPEIIGRAKTEAELRVEWPEATVPPKIKPDPEVRIYERLESRLELWSPDHAKWMFDNAAKKNNRNLKKIVNPAKVKNLASEMTNGHYMVTGDAVIILDWTGQIINGHHTICAQVQSNTDQVYMVSRGANPNSYHYLDIGQKRGTGHIIEVKHPDKKAIAAVGRMMCIYDSIGGDDRFGVACMGGNYSRQQDVIRYCKENENEITAAINTCTKGHTANYGAHSVIATSYALFCRNNSEKAYDFIQMLFTGTDADGNGLGQGHPIYYLRERLVDWRMRGRMKVQNDEVYALLFVAWKHFLTGKQVTENQIKWRKDSSFPILPGSAAATSIPRRSV